MDFQLKSNFANSILQILGGRSVSLNTFKQDFQVKMQSFLAEKVWKSRGGDLI